MRKTMTTTILTIGLLLWGGITAFAADTTVSGHLDSITGNNISGWAWDSAQPETSAAVRITITNKQSSQVVMELNVGASTYREDLAEAGNGTGYYGFNAPISWDELEDGIYQVDAYIADYKLVNSLSFTKGDTNGGTMTPLGSFKTTGYCPCYSCSEGWGRSTSTGALATASHTIAVDPKVIPYGSQVMIDGVIYTAEDRGGGVKGNHIDIYFDTHAETRQHGTRQQEVYLLNS